MRRLRFALLFGCLMCTALLFSPTDPLQSADKAKQKKKPPTPQWLWLHGKPKTNEIVYFRKTFELSAKPKKAIISTACDDGMSLFVNGQHILEHNTWQTPVREDIAKHLKQGKNAISVRGKNGSSAAGYIGLVEIETADGKKITFASDQSWLTSGDPQGNWRLADYDDSKWQKPHSFGPLGVGPWNAVVLDPRYMPKPQATVVSNVTSLPGFEVELLYSVPKPTQGSWVNMTPDPKGRLIVSDQYGSLYRVTPGKDADSTSVEKLDVNIGQAQGLLYAFDSLYVMVNGSAAQGSGLYRVTDTNGDDQFDKVTLIKKLSGGGEHGPHAIRLGPDGLLYVIAGNHTSIPAGIEATSPHRNWAEDLLLPRNPDGRGHATGRMAPGGWIARTDKDGKKWELFCAGFRNPYDIDFNLDGELFTYDADMEWDTGTPWYRPTRVNHSTSAAEFGWRFGTGKWPDYHADSLGAVVDIGMGSPTGIGFGTGARFPAKYQRALYINDWTYGKIYAVHMTPKGAGYTATFEPFVTGKPLPVTDVVINHDGAMYFTIGGRRTQSGLYRVTYTGKESTSPAGPIDDPTAIKARALRRQLESFHGRKDAKAVETAWPHLNSTDRRIRYAARVAIEHQDVKQWQDKALSEPRTTAAIHALIALARTGDKSLQGKIIQRLNALPYRKMTEEQLLAATRAYGLAFVRMGKPDAKTAAAAGSVLRPLYPALSEQVNRELCRVLVYLETPDVVGLSMKLLAAAQTQQDQLYYVFQLRNLKNGWTPQQRKAYFGWMNLAESSYKGGASFQKFVQHIRRDAVAKLDEKERLTLKDVIENKLKVEAVTLKTTRQFIHNWQIADLMPMLSKVETGRSFENGKAAYQAAQCYKCHRFKGSGGDTGPDVTGVGNRFKPDYLLEALILPSKVVSDQYINTTIFTDDGETITGRIIEKTDKEIKVRTDPFALELTVLPLDEIEEMQPSKLSEMPQGLINVLTKEEILDLIAYMRSGGNPKDKAFKK